MGKLVKYTVHAVKNCTLLNVVSYFKTIDIVCTVYAQDQQYLLTVGSYLAEH